MATSSQQKQGEAEASSSTSSEPPLWQFVTKIKKMGAGGTWEFKCNICNEPKKGSYSRVRAHLLGITGKEYEAATRLAHGRIVNWHWFMQSIRRRACLDETTYPIHNKSPASLFKPRIARISVLDKRVISCDANVDTALVSNIEQLIDLLSTKTFQDVSEVITSGCSKLDRDLGKTGLIDWTSDGIIQPGTQIVGILPTQEVSYAEDFSKRHEVMDRIRAQRGNSSNPC
ncbi:hypothetical protein SSX86_011253 [Deinandra increscens subsp. villosa]|uniref:BED-type domain-containing protein n=1 Tax=Deinandra increscens subsp. villosa TaxID=3103831 RepID=A0AAP0DAI5_9ASTR